MWTVAFLLLGLVWKYKNIVIILALKTVCKKGLRMYLSSISPAELECAMNSVFIKYDVCLQIERKPFIAAVHCTKTSQHLCGPLFSANWNSGEHCTACHQTKPHNKNKQNEPNELYINKVPTNKGRKANKV
jgi:hypothetical protein